MNSSPRTDWREYAILVALLIALGVLIQSIVGSTEPNLQHGSPHMCQVFGVLVKTTASPYVNRTRNEWAFVEAETGSRIQGKGPITCVELPPEETALLPENSVRESSMRNLP